MKPDLKTFRRGMKLLAFRWIYWVVQGLIILKIWNHFSTYWSVPVWNTTYILILSSIVGITLHFTQKQFSYFLGTLIHVKNRNYWKWEDCKWEFYIGFLNICTASLLSLKLEIFRIFSIQGLNILGNISHQLLCGVPVVSHLMSLGSQCDLTPWSYYIFTLDKLFESIACAFMGTLLAFPIAFILAFFAATNLTQHSKALRLFCGVLRFVMNVVRSIEVLVWGIMISVWVGIGPFAGMVALMIHTIASLTKQFAEAIENIPNGPIEALQTTGAHPLIVLVYGVIPQVWISYVSFTVYRWDINLRMSTVVGIVGGGGIGGLLFQETGMVHWTKVGSLTFLICIAVWLLDTFSSRLRRAIN